MSITEIATEVNAKLDQVREALAPGDYREGDVCLTCSFQAEDVLLTEAGAWSSIRDSDAVS